MINPFFFIILAALLLEFGLGVTANLLNLKALKVELPPPLEGMYEPDRYRRSQEYTRAATRFELVADSSKLALLLAFWFAGGFNYLNLIVAAWGYGPIASGLLYIGILFIAYNLVMLPFSIYATFGIEEHFGFNRTTPRTFVLDTIKGLALAVLLGGLLLAGILALFEYSGSFAWLYCWLAAIVVMVILQFVTPIWIMPLFNKFTPMQPGDLKEAILKYARSVGYTINNISVMDGSRRSSKSNAFFTGFGRSKRIALFDTLIAQHTVPELVAVLAHEVGHYKKKHIQQGILAGIVQTGIVFFLMSLVLGSSGLYQAFGVEQQPVYAGLLFFFLLYTPLALVLSIGMHIWSRRNEYEADRFAAETVEQPQSLVEALKKLSANNLSNLTPHPFYVFLNYSHPPLLQRIHAVERYKAGREGPPGGQTVLCMF